MDSPEKACAFFCGTPRAGRLFFKRYQFFHDFSITKQALVYKSRRPYGGLMSAFPDAAFPAGKWTR
jgi:hypothetical protein